MISNRRTCEICQESKLLNQRHYTELRPGVFRYTCRHCLGLPWQTHNVESAKPTDQADLIFAADNCSHPAVRTTTQPGQYPMRGYCNACQRVLVRETIKSSWTYTRRAQPYGENISSNAWYGVLRKKDEL